MAIIDTDKVVTVSQLVEELKISIPTARGLVDHLEPEATINRTSFYHREDVQGELYRRNETLFTFLGVRPPAESYDNNITAALEASENEQ